MGSGHMESAMPMPFRISPFLDPLYGSLPQCPPTVPQLGAMENRGLPLHPEYLQHMAFGQRYMLGDCIPNLYQQGVHDASDGSRLTSPRPSRHGRKRALSASPYLSDSMDITSVIKLFTSFIGGYEYEWFRSGSVLVVHMAIFLLPLV
ncbi:hypothetical protein CEXT_646031 [Caerostris extrusa]|uniref:Uncharacterized protein n=1 Tax=Caerostris extrusa TaxID=172846 RepID=A0AAV4MH71_CAEEX|nr:hypothetical protein CEXT_646031 [Caerostris extrusa]